MAYKIFLSPSNQTENVYFGVDTNEATQCGKIASCTKDALIRCGFEVMLMHMYSMPEKVEQADKWGADAYAPIHTNATSKHNATGTHLFCYNKTGEGYKICVKVLEHLGPLTPGSPDTISVRDDLYEVRMPDAPTVYIEVDFHDVPEVANWIVNHTKEIGEEICKGFCDYFNVPYVIEDPVKLYRVQVGSFKNREYAYDFLKEVRKHYPNAFVTEVK